MPTDKEIRFNMLMERGARGATIKALQEENDKLRAALEEIASDESFVECGSVSMNLKARQLIAKQALKKE